MHKFTAWHLVYAVVMAAACIISYAIIDELLSPFVERPDKLLGSMWAVVATVFVFRESRPDSLSAGLSRLIATCVSFALCMAYILAFPVTGFGIGVVIGVGTIVMIVLGREEDIVTTGITTTVVLVVAAMNPDHAWQQPPLRLLDTLVGIGVGVACKWTASYAFCRAKGVAVR